MVETIGGCMQEIVINEQHIQNKIYTLRGLQVMLDSDLAVLYHVETKQLNKAVNRNIKRFPHSFRFQLTQEEYEDILRFQIGTSSLQKHGGRRYMPYVFTKQGISMLSAVLRSDVAIDVSIKIIEAFVSMRKFLLNHASVFQKLDTLETKLLKHDANFTKIFDAMESQTLQPTQGIFYDGQVFDAYVFISKLIKGAKHSIVLIDNYIDESVLTLFSKNQNIQVTLYTKTISKQLKLDVEKYNTQYKPIVVKKLDTSHDRFLIIDEVEVYHVGASLKDLGKKWFAFSRMDAQSLGILERL